MGRDNLSIIFAERPKAAIIPGQTFKQKTTPAPTEAALRDGDLLVEVLYLSMDPAMRTWMMNDRSYMAPLKIGQPMAGPGVCRVLASKSPLASPGDIVTGYPGWTEISVLRAGTFDPQSEYPESLLRAPHEMLSALGMTSLTAWFGMTQIGDPKPGELVVVSGAAGATGSVAGQIAKMRGARVIGIAGSDEKCEWLTDELGFDKALNYKDDDFRKKFVAATKGYIDVYYDNVGGETLDLALMQAKEHARFVECGLVSQYNSGKPYGPSNFFRVVTMRIRMEGFIVTDHKDRYAEARAELAQWLADGKIKKTETIVKGGLKKAEHTLVDLYNGVNTGKLILEVKNPNEAPAKL